MSWCFITTVLVATGSVLTTDINNDNHDECGLTPRGEVFVIGGKPAKVNEVPWHASIYAKSRESSYKQLCGGSIVTTTAVITGALCSWKNGKGKQSPDLYSVAVGMIHRIWTDDNYEGVQFSNVTDTHVPDTFRGSETNYQNDIAIFVLQTAIVYKPYIRPVCLSFNPELNRMQLMPGNPGKIAVWRFDYKKGKRVRDLQGSEMSFMAHDKCYDESPPDFREYITSDKFCIGLQNGTGRCSGNAGAGLAFPEHERGVQRYYLQGIASVMPSGDGGLCGHTPLLTFTELIKHESWIKTVLSTKEL